MLQPTLATFLKEICGTVTGAEVRTLKTQGVGGGSINNCYRVELDSGRLFFLKTNNANRFPGLFEKEKYGIEFLAAQGPIRLPSVVYCGYHDGEQVLLLEWIAPGARSNSFWREFGEKLAGLHKVGNDMFGFLGDNYMGALPQQNNSSDSWTSFFQHFRLEPQVELAVRNNMLNKPNVDLFEQLYKKLDAIFNKESPSLLHGDLWSGNFMCDTKSSPVLIDPAVYFGHRSMDLGMTTLFGGFEREFYTAYNYHFPLPTNHEEQWEICNLYPLLIHLNLFGQSYLHDIATILKKYA